MAAVCFCLMPALCSENRLWFGAVGILTGSILLSLAERNGFGRWGNLICVFAALGVPVFWQQVAQEQPLMLVALQSALCGAMLYLCCCGILPEEGSSKEKALAAAFGGVGFLGGMVWLLQL